MKGNLCSMGITYTIWRSREQGRFEIKKKKKKKKKKKEKKEVCFLRGLVLTFEE
jgi:uncharacterized protein YqhQ